MVKPIPPSADNPNKSYRVIWGPQRFRLSIGWKTLIAFALVVFIPMLGLMQITGKTLRDAMENETLHSLEANLRGAWRVYYERSNNIRSALILSASTPSVKSAMGRTDSRELTEVLTRHAALMPYVDVLLALGPDQRIVARRNGQTGEQVFLNNLVSRAYTFLEGVTSTELLPNQIFIGENPLRYSNLDTQVMAQVVIVPVQDSGSLLGSLVGLVLMNDDDWLPNAIHDYLSIDAALFGSVIQESRIISASDRPNNIWAAGLLAPDELNRAINRGETYRGEIMINEIPSYVISEPILNNEGIAIGALSIGLKRSGIDELIQYNARNIYLFIGVGILLSLIIAFLAYRDTMTPIRAMMGAMDDFADGNLGVRTELKTKDEFEWMGQGFNRMAAAVQEHQERVESFNSLTSLLITSLKPQELLQKVLDKVIDLTTSQAGVIYLARKLDEEKILEPYVSFAVDVATMPKLHFGQGLPGEAALDKRVVHARHIPSDCKVTINFGLMDTLPKEVVIFPIVYREEVLGVMLLGSVNEFQPNEVSLLEYITNQIAVVLENALAHEQVERLSITDGLTGVYNRRYISERLDEELSKTSRYGSYMSLLLIDIDHFKSINDDFGHHTGDQALLSVTRAMAKSLRQSDLLGRYGGEEFLVVLPHTGPADALAVAEKLRKSVEQVMVPGMAGVPLSVSVGVASYPDHGVNNADQFVQLADRALYQAKENGRNRVVAAA